MHTIYTLATGFFLAAVFVWYTRRKNALTLDGALTAAATGLWVLVFAGPIWLLPLFFFFLSSTLLGKLNKTRLSAADTKQGQARDYRQVLCNGGVYAALATGMAGPEAATVQSLMVLSLAVSTADTWSSEIGQFFRQKTVDILRWQPVPPGLSGGVSWAGSLGGLAGGLAMALLGGALAGTVGKPAWLGLFTLGGFAGMLLDSLLGAGLQARYRDAGSDDLYDQAGENRVLHNGFEWMSNDAVNWWSNVLVTGLGWAVVCAG